MSVVRSIGWCASLALAVAAGRLQAQQPVYVAPNAPPDRGMDATTDCQWRAAVKAMAPFVAQARATFPEARRRYVAGLGSRSTFFVATRLHDDRGRTEQVFVAVDSVGEASVMGRIWSQIEVVSGYRLRQPYTLPDSEVVDWMFSKPDGSEEGNVVGKFLDTYKPPATCTDSLRR